MTTNGIQGLGQFRSHIQQDENEKAFAADDESWGKPKLAAGDTRQDAR